MAADIKPTTLLTAMKRRYDKRLTVRDLCVAMKLDPAVWDNCAAVIWAVTKLHEQGKVEFELVGESPYKDASWFVRRPKQDREDAMAPAP